MSRWDDLSASLEALDAYMARVSGETAVHFFAPLDDATFEELADDLRAHGWTIATTGTHSFNATDDASKLRFVTDEDMLRVQLLASAHPEDDWAFVNSMVGSSGAHVSGDATDWTPPATTDANAQASFLSRAAQHVQDTWNEAQSYADTKKQEIAQQVAPVVDKATVLAKDVAKGIVENPVITAAQTDTGKSLVADAQQTLSDVGQKVKGFATGAAGFFGLNFGVGLVVTAIVAWFLLKPRARAA